MTSDSHSLRMWANECRGIWIAFCNFWADLGITADVDNLTGVNR